MKRGGLESRQERLQVSRSSNAEAYSVEQGPASVVRGMMHSGLL